MEFLLVLLSVALAVDARSYSELFRIGRHFEGDSNELGPRVIGGYDAKEREFPWMVALHYQGRFVCSAFLVTPRVILTAAHCVVFGREAEPPSKYNAYVGTINRDGPDTEILFSETIAHPKYGSDTEYDLAIMRLKEPVTLNDNIQTVCLPEKGDKYERQIGQAMGWGVYEKNGREPAKVLQTVPQNITANDQCTLIYGILQIPVTKRHVCAGGERDSGICFGDSGGPLVSLNETKPVAIGIASFVSYRGCASRHIPAVYTNIESYSDWIDDNLGEDAKDICKGDSGGPLVSLNETRPVAVGIASFGSFLGCAVGGIPAVYTSTESYLDWIKENMGADAADLCQEKKISESRRRTWG